MRAVVMRGGELVVDDVAELAPQPGQAVARVLACGICGSDLHALRHADRMVEMSTHSAAPDDPMTPTIMDPTRDVVMGHEFCCEILEVGENVGNSRPGDIVVSMPIVFDASGIHPIGYSNHYPGGYAEQLLVADVLTIKVPNGLSPRLASLTEPMAVGLHAVNKAGATERHGAVVLGCGPVGLAVIAALKLAGCQAIVAADFSARRRDLATAMGATEVVDPSEESAVAAWRRVDGRRSLVIFEAVGVPGMLDGAIVDAPRNARVCVVGVCMEPDTIRPMIAIGKELSFQFVLGYDPMEFGETLRRIAEGELDVEPLITGEVGLDGVADAFVDLGHPDDHAKILVIP
jgi:threonine dehydrogenase-like Zn-dependent dehydrogenase